MTLATKPVRSKIMSYSIVALLTITAAATALSAFSTWKKNAALSSMPQVGLVKAATRVTALGRLEPQAEVTRLSAPMMLEKDRVAELRIKQGDRVEAGQVVAVLDSYDRLKLTLIEAEEQVNVAQSKLTQVKSGPKVGEIQAQKAAIAKLEAELTGEISTQNSTIDRWQSEVNNAQTEYQRFQSLAQQGAIANADLDRKRLAVETAQAQLAETTANQQRTINTLQAQISAAQATLSQITELRPVDLNIAQMEVNRAIALRQRAENDLQQTVVRAPIAGQILKVHARPGEKLGDVGIAELGQTQQMVAVAEIYQSDITKVQMGQAVTITSSAFDGELRGNVSDIGLQVNRQNVFNRQPGENLDRRVIEVKIQLTPEDSQRVTSLTNLQVQVAIAI
jgi:HlyD family secretion protein